MATTAIPTKPRHARPHGRERCSLMGRVALGVIFVIAAYTKLHFNGAWHFGDYHFFFAMAIDSYKMLPISAVQLDGANPAVV